MTAEINGYLKDLQNSTTAQSYLKGRGFNDIDFLMDDFCVGCSINPQDYFGGYITMPVISDEGLETITSRTYSNKTPLHKHRNGRIEFFYNHEIIFEEDEIVLVESPLCCLSLEYIGVPAMATLGSGKLPDFYDDFDDQHTIIVIPDADYNNAGILGAQKIATKLHGLVKEVKIGKLPLTSGTKKLDINDLFKKDRSTNKKAFQRQINYIIKNAETFVPKEEPKKYRRRNRGRDLTQWKDRFDIVDIVSGYIALEHTGSVFQGLCPFHNDHNTPSFTVYPETNSFFCFSPSCDAQGDVIDFIRLIRNVDFKEAKAYLEIYY